MRLSKSEVERRKNAVLTYFRKNPTASVAKMNKALVSGELTGKPEKMLNIATGYAWRRDAIANPELPNIPPTPGATLVSSDGATIDPTTVVLDDQGVPESPLIGGTPAPKE